ncbi:hypothetical protein GF327_07950 [Candidatus Woesearchaeota archaeon]|nr:hypothetical protein [Candidatus Woesearchaeota archaeon]
MKTIKLLKQLETYPLFTVNDFAKILRSTAKYARTKLYRLEKQGLIKRIERGKYTVHDDPFIFASHILYPSYISMWSLFDLKELTEQVLREIMIVTTKSKKDIKKKSYRISFTNTTHCFGYYKEIYHEHEIFLADVEKAIIDSLLYNKVPFDEIKKAIVNSELNIEKIKAYVKRIGSSTLIKRIGYLMEKKGQRLEAKEIMDYNYVRLNPDKPKKGKKNKKWRLIINDNQG